MMSVLVWCALLQPTRARAVASTPSVSRTAFTLRPPPSPGEPRPDFAPTVAEGPPRVPGASGPALVDRPRSPQEGHAGSHPLGAFEGVEERRFADPGVRPPPVGQVADGDP